MKIEVGEIRVVSGEFRIHQDGPGLPSTSEEKASLLVACQYAMTDRRGVSFAFGTASNSPSASTTSLELSESTLNAFATFFNYLRHDIATSLEATTDAGTPDNKRTELERLLGGVKT